MKDDLALCATLQVPPFVSFGRFRPYVERPGPDFSREAWGHPSTFILPPLRMPSDIGDRDEI